MRITVSRVDSRQCHPYIFAMRFLPWAVALALFAGCSQSNVMPQAGPGPTEQEDLFGPSTMRLHPIFTQIKSFSGGEKPDGIEAVLEFDDQFEDSTKAAGSIIFELYAMQKGFADPRGERLAEPWTAHLGTVDEQKAHWRREIGAYSFLLAYGNIEMGHDYVLTATFEPLNGKRLFAQTILTGPAVAKPAASEPIN